MTFFDMKEQVDGYFREIETHPQAELAKPISNDSAEGLQQIADLLTYLPEESRKATVIGFVLAMLCD